MWQASFGRESARLRIRTLRLATLIGIAVAQLAISSVLVVPPAQAQQSRASLQDPIQISGTAQPTLGWRKFCERYPAECAVDPTEPALISLSTAVWNTLTSVNARVNATVKSVTDREHWGVEDQWDFAEDGYGDCEDFQLLKRRLLVKAGLPRRALRMTVVIDEEGAGHAVLMVRTDRGDLILDNKRNAVLPWIRTGYVFVKREGSDGPSWASLGGRASPTMTANR
jgi:predicted transglutaminase-like cysteine proteinase